MYFQLNDERRYLPFSEVGGKIELSRHGGFVQVTSQCGIRVQFDGSHYVTVTVPRTFSGNLTGLCGDCNGEADDFTTKSGYDVSGKPGAGTIVGNSYIVKENGDSSYVSFLFTL